MVGAMPSSISSFAVSELEILRVWRGGVDVWSGDVGGIVVSGLPGTCGSAKGRVAYTCWSMTW
jgi:hypothetical protein